MDDDNSMLSLVDADLLSSEDNLSSSEDQRPSPRQARRKLDNDKRVARKKKKAAARERLLARRARREEWGGAFQLAAEGTMDRGVHSLFKTVAKEIKKDVPEMAEPGSEVAPFIPEPRTFSDVVRLPVDLN